MVFQTLNKLKWAGSLDRYEVFIRHRGAPGDVKTKPGRSLTELKRTYFFYDSGRWEVTIPLHRVLGVYLDGKTVCKKR